jgi:hypothetical protein
LFLHSEVASFLNHIFCVRFLGLRGCSQQELTENDVFELEEISEEIRLLENRLAKLLNQKNPSISSPRVAKKAAKNSHDYKKVGHVDDLAEVGGLSFSPDVHALGGAGSVNSVNFGTLPRKVPGRKFTIQMNK